MADSVDPDEMAHYEWSHQDLNCLQMCLFQSAGLKELMEMDIFRGGGGGGG